MIDHPVNSIIGAVPVGIFCDDIVDRGHSVSRQDTFHLTIYHQMSGSKIGVMTAIAGIE